MDPSPFLGLPSAVALESAADAGVPSHYGNPLAEQRRLDEGLALVDLSTRPVFELRGEDRLTWINSITSADLLALTPGDSGETLFLDPQGRIEHAVPLIEDGVSLWLLPEASSAPALWAWLLKMRFRSRVEILDRTADYARIGVMERADAPLFSSLNAVAPHGVPLIWRDPWAAVVPGGWQYAAADSAGGHPGDGFAWREVLLERSGLGALAAAHPVAGSLAAEALRIAAWRPRESTEVDDKSIPHESDWLRTAVHLNKGCYRGQETVAKVHNLGHPPRRLVMLNLDGSEGFLPDPGSEVRAFRNDEPRIVGAITSSALHYELGPIALALIRRAVDPTIDLSVAQDEGWIAAGQEVIVPSDAGSVADIPKLPRLGARR
ncbi:CAF17-like 4Fe-4S cluster assembly/insertion protein YgfZ [Mycetocola spongiae]|uniref:CAF17-like 4Fe-4S cluster assembly/insertion protein YgfZ n=1 Tax=Mycetocola spongiae TaxID=2859226 RepID=UPI001CF11D60|nr:folate-binding protein [Mycetocola spongiae]UCR88769.1 folate-binding protein [Mycetocola spongiae]